MAASASGTELALLVEQGRGQPIPEAETSREDVHDGGFPWLTGLGFAFLTFNSVMAIYRAEGDLATVAFVSFSYIDLVILFCCLRMFERAPRGPSSNSTRMRALRGTAWVLTVLLSILFGWKVASSMPLPVAAAVWIMAAATVIGGVYAFFRHGEVGLRA